MLLIIPVAVILLFIIIAAGLPTRPARVQRDSRWQRFFSGRKSSAAPLIVYGHLAEELAAELGQISGIDGIAVSGLDNLQALLAAESELGGILATSRPEHPGEAGAAIALFRAGRETTGLALYGAWDYNVKRAAQKAMQYQADGILMPDMINAEIEQVLVGLRQRLSKKAARPTTVTQHRELLREYAPDSEFWSHQRQTASIYY